MAFCEPVISQVCDGFLECPEPSAEHACISGQLFDFETSEPIRVDPPTGSVCSSITSDGPCSIGLAAYDSLSFYSNPTGAPPLSADIVIDDCGRYLVSDLPVPPLGFVTLALDDASMVIDNLVLSASTIPTTGGQELSGRALYSVQRVTDENWTTSAGDPFAGQTFSEVGVFAAIFVTGEVLTSGVTLTRGGAAQEEDDYYFSDSSSLVRSSIDSQLTETGLNGSALMVNSPLVGHSGMGGELTGCVWPDELGISLLDAVVIQEFPLLAQSTSNPCPLEVFTDGFESGDASAWSGTSPQAP